MADEMIRVAHPEVGVSPNPVSRAGFEAEGGWRDLGWTEIEPLVADASEVAGVPVTGLESLTKDQLTELAATQGVDIAGASTKADIASAISRAEQR